MATTNIFLRTRPFRHHTNGNTPDGHEAPSASGPAPRTSRFGTVTAVVALGVFVDAVAYALARSSHSGPAIPLFLVGLIVIYVPCAWRLTSATATRRERVGVSVVLGAGMLVAYILRSPLIFDGFDELLHGATLAQLMSGHSLLASNTALPVSPYFPGLELLTMAVKWLTGLPVVLAESVVLLATRIVLMLCIFLVVERVCGTARSGESGFSCTPRTRSSSASTRSTPTKRWLSPWRPGPCTSSSRPSRSNGHPGLLPVPWARPRPWRPRDSHSRGNRPPPCPSCASATSPAP